MNTISNRFFIQALEDGTTLHGNLVSMGSLTQAWTGTTAVPDWSQAAYQPNIYLTLLAGNTLVVPQDVKWYYNGGGSHGDILTEIQFSDTPSTISYTDTTTSPSTSQSVTGYISTDGKFMKYNRYIKLGESRQLMPCLRIIQNIASSNNVDVDYITLTGTYGSAGGEITFSCSIQVKITGITSNGKIGIINFANGISDITEPGQTVVLYGELYDSNGSMISGASTKWYLNDSSTAVNGTTVTDPLDNTVSYTNAFSVTESQVVDHATVKCTFVLDGNDTYTAYAAIDDMQDPEYMYIQNGGANGNAASLHKDQNATFEIWVGRRDDSAVLGGASTPTYNTIKVKLLDGSGEVITATGLSGSIPDPDASGDDVGTGYRTLTMTSGKATITIPYSVVLTYGKNITGIIKAIQTV